MFDVIPVTTSHHTACGPACLKMLLAWYGIEVDLEQLIEECDVKINGCSMKDLIRVGRAHGLDDLAVWQEAPAEVLQQDRPAIVWWRYTHYVVYAGLNEQNEPVICNPSQGRYAIDAGTFKNMLSGLEPGTCVALCNGKPGDLRRVACANYAEGEYFTLNGELCKAKVPIANGAILTLNTNYIITTVEDELSTLNR